MGFIKNIANAMRASASPEETEPKTELSKAIDCMVQHIKVFHIQSFNDRLADFGEPCSKCPYVKECKYDWLSKMNPLLSQSNIRISVAIQELEEIMDNDDIHHGGS